MTPATVATPASAATAAPAPAETATFELSRDRLMTLREVAEHLAVSLASVHRMAARRQLRTIRIGNRRGVLRVTRGELERVQAEGFDRSW